MCTPRAPSGGRPTVTKGLGIVQVSSLRSPCVALSAGRAGETEGPTIAEYQRAILDSRTGDVSP